MPTPRGDYAATIGVIADLVTRLEERVGARGSVGVGMPGTVSPRSGVVKNANSTWLNGRAFDRDLAAALGREVRCANDANCLALSEASDGAGAGAAVVFAVILGTGVGGALTVDGRVVVGANGVAGEWGHTPLPWPTVAERPGPSCWCGRRGCLETWLSGPALQRDHAELTGRRLSGPEVVAAALAGDDGAAAALDRYADRLARALAVVVDLLDPHVVVLGGGVSNASPLYAQLPALVRPHVFGGEADLVVRPAAHGDSSGVRGAAWLWERQPRAR